MSSWTIIRDQFTRGKKCGTVGYLRRLNEAAELAVRLRCWLSDSDKAIEEMNADKELTEALFRRAELKEILE